MSASRMSAIAAALSLVVLSACEEAPGAYVEIEGGGFVFNYRIAEVFYGVSVKPLRRLEPGSIIEARFENPAGGEPIDVRQEVTGARLSYALRTPGVTGVKAGKPYRVELRVLARDGRVLQTIARTFTSDLDQSVNPDVPLTIGPGYTPNPAAADPAGAKQ